MKAQVITGDANHTSVVNLRGWSIVGSTPVLNLRKLNATGDIVATVGASGSFVLPSSLDTEGGCWVEVVSGSITTGVLWY